MDEGLVARRYPGFRKHISAGRQGLGDGYPFVRSEALIWHNLGAEDVAPALGARGLSAPEKIAGPRTSTSRKSGSAWHAAISLWWARIATLG